MDTALRNDADLAALLRLASTDTTALLAQAERTAHPDVWLVAFGQDRSAFFAKDGRGGLSLVAVTARKGSGH